jgi:hypothetical protein
VADKFVRLEETFIAFVNLACMMILWRVSRLVRNRKVYIPLRATCYLLEGGEDLNDSTRAKTYGGDSGVP